jgi:hypothetical protein
MHRARDNGENSSIMADYIIRVLIMHPGAKVPMDTFALYSAV